MNGYVMDDYGLSYEEENLLKKLDSRLYIGQIYNIIDLYKYNKTFGKENIEKVNKQIEYILNKLSNKEKKMYGTSVIECRRQECQNIIYKLLCSEKKITFDPYSFEMYDLHINEIMHKNELMKKYNFKKLLQECLYDLEVDSVLVNNDVFLINLMPILEKDICSYKINFCSLYKLDNDYYEKMYKQNKEYLKSVLKKILIIESTDKEVRVQIKKIGNNYFISNDKFLSVINDNCKYYNGVYSHIYTFSYNKRNCYISLTHATSSFSRVKNDTQYRRIYGVETDTKVTVYNEKSQMVIDYGSIMFNEEELNDYNEEIIIPSGGKLYKSYRLEVIPNTNKARYISVEDNKTIVLIDTDLIYDDVVIDFRFMEQFVGNSIDVELNTYDSFKSHMDIFMEADSYMRSKKIPYMLSKDEERLCISKIKDFNVDIMCKNVKELEYSEKEKNYRRKLENYRMC